MSLGGQPSAPSLSVVASRPRSQDYRTGNSRPSHCTHSPRSRLSSCVKGDDRSGGFRDGAACSIQVPGYRQPCASRRSGAENEMITRVHQTSGEPARSTRFKLDALLVTLKREIIRIHEHQTLKVLRRLSMNFGSCTFESLLTTRSNGCCVISV